MTGWENGKESQKNGQINHRAVAQHMVQSGMVV
jgi:hypothetical protein